MNRNNEGKKYFLTVKGEKVEVSEEVYREYKKPHRAEKKRIQRMCRCRILRDDFKKQKSYMKRCLGDCSKCENKEVGSVLSLNALADSGWDRADETNDIESNLIDQETRKEERAAVHNAIAKLTPRQQEIVKLYFYQGKTQVEIAEELGIKRTAVENALQRILVTLKKFLEKNQSFFL